MPSGGYDAIATSRDTVPACHVPTRVRIFLACTLTVRTGVPEAPRCRRGTSGKRATVAAGKLPVATRRHLRMHAPVARLHAHGPSAPGGTAAGACSCRHWQREEAVTAAACHARKSWHLPRAPVAVAVSPHFRGPVPPILESPVEETGKRRPAPNAIACRAALARTRCRRRRVLARVGRCSSRSARTPACGGGKVSVSEGNRRVLIL